MEKLLPVTSLNLPSAVFPRQCILPDSDQTQSCQQLQNGLTKVLNYFCLSDYSLLCKRLRVFYTKITLKVRAIQPLPEHFMQ